MKAIAKLTKLFTRPVIQSEAESRVEGRSAIHSTRSTISLSMTATCPKLKVIKLMLAIIVAQLAFLSAGSAYGAHRDMIILIDATEYNAQQYGAITAQLIHALHQKAVPILVSNALVHRVLYYINQYVKQTRYQGSKPYQWRQLLLHINLAYTPEEEALFEQLYYDPLIMCAGLSEFYELTAWDMYLVNDSFCLLIPHAYKNRLALHDEIALTTTYKDAQTQRPLEQYEIDLGIKVGGLKKINRKYLECFAQGSVKTSSKLSAVLPKLFVTRSDLAMPADVVQEYATPLHTWNFYMSGHGKYSHVNDQVLCALHPEDVIAHELIHHDNSRLLRGISEKVLTHVCKTNSTQDVSVHASDTQSKQHAATTADELTKADAMVRSADGRIAGMSVLEFRAMLDFFNNAIQTNFLFYQTCYSGLLHRELPYLLDIGSKRLNYSVATAGIDATPSAMLRPYFERDVGGMVFKTEYDFLHFFEDLHTVSQATLGDAVNRIAFVNRGCEVNLGNIPVIRYPGATKFCPLKSKITTPHAPICLFDEASPPTVLADKKVFCVNVNCVPQLVIDKRFPLIVNEKRNVLFEGIKVHIDLIKMKSIFNNFFTCVVGEQEGRQILIEELSVNDSDPVPVLFFNTLQQGLAKHILWCYGQGMSYTMRLQNIFIIDNGIDILGASQERVNKIYFSYQRNCFVATQDLTDIQRLDSHEAQDYKKKYMVLKSHIKAQQ